MKSFAYLLVILAACLPFQAQAAGDNPSPGLLAKIQLPPTQAVGGDGVSTKKHGGLDVSKSDDRLGDISQKMQIDINSANSPRPPAAIGGAIGNHASENNED